MVERACYGSSPPSLNMNRFERALESCSPLRLNRFEIFLFADRFPVVSIPPTRRAVLISRNLREYIFETSYIKYYILPPYFILIHKVYKIFIFLYKKNHYIHRTMKVKERIFTRFESNRIFKRILSSIYTSMRQ